MTEQFSPEERAALSPYCTNLDGPVFALVNLPEVVKGALFARYSRSPKSLRRLFLDEFLPSGTSGAIVGFDTKRAEELYGRIFFEYGDDSVAQLGGVHLACEGASNILTKVLEWGRLAAYLEQSTRYIPYDDLVAGRYRYHVPRELEGDLRTRYVETLDAMFDTYRALLPVLRQHFTGRFPRDAQTSEAAYRTSIRAKALDTLRGLLPAATTSNVGIYGTGQAYENLLIRMRAHPLQEVRAYADLMLVELRKVIPAFLRRVDLPDRGVAWSSYLDETRRATTGLAAEVLADEAPTPRDEVTLTDFDPDGEAKVVAAAYVGRRTNRRHRPGRAFERTSYRFDVLADYGAFRDLQRHRVLTLEWQRLSPRHGSVMPEAVVEARVEDRWHRALDASASLHDAIAAAGLAEVAPYAVAMAYRIRFYMEMNAREAMHVIELRSAPQGHPAYRRIAQTMHRLIAERAGHRVLAAAMTFADHSDVALERLEAERAAERRRGGGHRP
jgi:thymidylate synthase ThyX